MILRRLTLAFACLTGLILPAFTQGSGTVTNKLLGSLNAIQTTVPFLTIAPDSRAGAMGDLGAATSPDANSQTRNAAKYAFIENKMGVSLSYVPWLRSLVNDIGLASVVGFGKFGDKQAIAGSLRFFSMGAVMFTDNDGNELGEVKPNEWTIDATTRNEQPSVQAIGHGRRPRRGRYAGRGFSRWTGRGRSVLCGRLSRRGRRRKHIRGLPATGARRLDAGSGRKNSLPSSGVQRDESRRPSQRDAR